ncbi:hypothetical protein ARMSODRAFT_1023744 [Armillaria solidipes]|uniref:Retrotransposon gag domain-containing protein n=1 Tax=Armillaria solidipes TaxID=1076256 RepID=A0A2H3BJ14_9AGAR|nr:hypothetical protein ARMSODRAFT_1023744 [Armillaria solidipes]
MIQVPKVFTGEHVDIERFFGDCMMYFEAHASYFILPSHMIPFATSLFDGPAKTWWVHKRMEYWSASIHDPVYARFRYPDWAEFVTQVTQQFRDPAVEEYFQELEEEAMQVNRRNETGPRDLMVKAVRLGVPHSYTSFISNHGENIPVTYDQWKTCICTMYEERQKQLAFNQNVGMQWGSRQKGTGITATSHL